MNKEQLLNVLELLEAYGCIKEPDSEDVKFEHIISSALTGKPVYMFTQEED